MIRKRSSQEHNSSFRRPSFAKKLSEINGPVQAPAGDSYGLYVGSGASGPYSQGRTALPIRGAAGARKTTGGYGQRVFNPEIEEIVDRLLDGVLPSRRQSANRYGGVLPNDRYRSNHAHEEQMFSSFIPTEQYQVKSQAAEYYPFDPASRFVSQAFEPSRQSPLHIENSHYDDYEPFNFLPDESSTPLSHEHDVIDVPSSFIPHPQASPRHTKDPSPPIIHGILKNNHLQPFYLQAQRRSPAPPLKNVAFGDNPVHRYVSPSLASSSPPSKFDTPTRIVHVGPTPFVPQPQAPYQRSENGSRQSALRRQQDAHHPGDVYDQDEDLQMTPPRHTVGPPKISSRTYQAQNGDPFDLPPKLAEPFSAMSTVSRQPASLPQVAHIPTPLSRAYQDIIDHRRQRAEQSAATHRQSRRRSVETSDSNDLEIGVNAGHQGVSGHHGVEPEAYQQLRPVKKDQDIKYNDDYAHSGNSDELNLRSLEEQEAQDWTDHQNYPRQMEYDDNDDPMDGNYSPSETSVHHLRITEAAFQFQVPKEVEDQARQTRKRSQKKEPIGAKSRSNSKRRTKATIDTSLARDPVRNPSTSPRIEEPSGSYQETIESIRDFSDDGMDDQVHEDDVDMEMDQAEEGVPKRLSPVLEEDEATAVDGFFGDGGALGFQVYKDGY